MNKGHLFLALLVLALLSACKGVDDIRFKGVDEVVFTGMENNKINFSARVGVINPSSVGFKVSEVNLKTSIDGSYIGTLTTDDVVKIQAKSDSSYQMNFSLELANLLTGASTLYNMSRKKQVTVEMQGYVRARSWFTFKEVDVNEKRLIDVPSLNR